MAEFTIVSVEDGHVLQVYDMYRSRKIKWIVPVGHLIDVSRRVYGTLADMLNFDGHVYPPHNWNAP